MPAKQGCPVPVPGATARVAGIGTAFVHVVARGLGPDGVGFGAEGADALVVPLDCLASYFGPPGLGGVLREARSQVSGHANVQQPAVGTVEPVERGGELVSDVGFGG